MNPSKPYTREERRKGLFVIEQPIHQVLRFKSKWKTFLQAIRFKKKTTRTVKGYMYCNASSDAPEWVTTPDHATPFKYELAHTFVKELELNDATVKRVAKFQNKIIVI